MIGIYKITSPAKRVYIGQSIDIERRFNKYKKISTCKGQVKLYRSFLKYGLLNHKFEIIVACDIKELNEQERYYQDCYNVLKNGLNCRLTTTDDRSGEMSDEAKEKMSKSQKGKKNSLGCKRSDETKLKISLAGKGKKHSDEQNLQKSLRQKGKIFSDETRAKLSLAQKGVKNMLGKTHSDETKLKMSISAKKVIRKPMTDEHKRNMSISKQSMSDETKLKMSLSKIGNKNGLGYKHSEESKRKRSILTTAYWANKNNNLKTIMI